MARIVNMEIVGKEYPMSFSLMATKKIAKDYGSVENMLTKMKNEADEGTIDIMTNIITLLIAQGCAYKNYFEKDVPPPDNAPIIDGKWTPLPKEAVEIAITIDEFELCAKKIEECIGGSKEKELDIKPPAGSEKNAEATQE